MFEEFGTIALEIAQDVIARIIVDSFRQRKSVGSSKIIQELVKQEVNNSCQPINQNDKKLVRQLVIEEIEAVSHLTSGLKYQDNTLDINKVNSGEDEFKDIQNQLLEDLKRTIQERRSAKKVSSIEKSLEAPKMKNLIKEEDKDKTIKNWSQELQEMQKRIQIRKSGE